MKWLFFPGVRINAVLARVHVYGGTPTAPTMMPTGPGWTGFPREYPYPACAIPAASPVFDLKWWMAVAYNYTQSGVIYRGATPYFFEVQGPAGQSVTLVIEWTERTRNGSDTSFPVVHEVSRSAIASLRTDVTAASVWVTASAVPDTSVGGNVFVEDVKIRVSS